MMDTWFEVIKAEPSHGGKFFVIRMDRANLPTATVVSGPHATEAEAQEIAAQMRETGTA